MRRCLTLPLRPLLSLLYVSLWTSAQAAEVLYPEEFSDFFTDVEHNIHVVLAGDRSGQDVSASVNYERFLVEVNSASERKLRLFLESKGLKKEAIHQIITQANDGIISDSECEDRLSQCVLSAYPDRPRYVFDFDNSRLKIFISPTALAQQSEQVEYEDPFNEGNGIINWSNLYGYTSFSDNPYFTWSNLTTVGLPLGYLTFDTQYRTEEKQFDVYTATYDVEYENHRLQVGRSNYNFSFNTTDTLNNGAKYSGDSIAIGTSHNLLKGRKEELQRIYFYAPQNGQLEIYRDERMIYNKVVSEGKQYISYADLPKGVYEATILLKVSGQALLEERRQIVNNNQFSLLVGETDYVVAFGRLDDYLESRSDRSQNDEYQSGYAKALASHRFNDYWMISGGLVSDNNDRMYQAGSSLFLGDKLSFDYVASFFSSDDFYQSANLSYAPFFADFRKLDYDLNNPEARLSSQLYGNSSYQDLGVGVSGSLLDNFIYLRYSRYKSDDADAYDRRYGYDRWLVNGGITRRLSKGSLSLNVDYYESHSSRSELNTNLTWTHDFDANYSSQVTVYANKDGFDYNTNYLRVNQQGENWSSNSALGVTITDDNQISADLSVTATGDTDKVNGNMYAYTNDQGTKSFSGGLSGTQIISSKGIDFTKSQARTFIRIEKELDLDNDSDAENVQYIISKDGQYSNKNSLDQAVTLLPLEDYRYTILSVEDMVDNVDIENGRHQNYSHPGSVYQVDTKLVSLLNKVILLEDFYGNPIKNVQCIGDGCVSVETLSDDGVFRVNYRKSKSYRLVSRKGLCIFDEQSNDAYSYGYCLPGLETDKDKANWRQSSQLLQENESHELLVYLGKFNQGKEANDITQRLTSLDITFKNIQVANDIYIYIIQDRDFNQAQRSLLQELDAYVLLRNSEIDLLTLQQNAQLHGGLTNYEL